MESWEPIERTHDAKKISAGPLNNSCYRVEMNTFERCEDLDVQWCEFARCWDSKMQRCLRYGDGKMPTS